MDANDKPDELDLERILIKLIDQVTEGDGETLTETEVAYKALATVAIQALIDKQKKQAYKKGYARGIKVEKAVRNLADE